MIHSDKPCANEPRRVIVVTDGDHIARRALQIAAKQIHARVISRSAGNPTPLSGIELVGWIRRAAYDPVIVMLDDNGDRNEAKGEEALQVLLSHPDINVIGALAVASNTSSVKGVAIDYSIDRDGRIVETGVDKEGNAIGRYMVFGDTVDSLDGLARATVVGIGDIGKMAGKDAPERGAPITTKALKTIIERSSCTRRPFESEQQKKRTAMALRRSRQRRRTTHRNTRAPAH